MILGALGLESIQPHLRVQQFFELRFEGIKRLLRVFGLEGVLSECVRDEFLRVEQRRRHGAFAFEEVLAVVGKVLHGQGEELVGHGLAIGDGGVVDDRHPLVDGRLREPAHHVFGHALFAKHRFQPHRDGDPFGGDFADRRPQAVRVVGEISLSDELQCLGLDPSAVQFRLRGAHARAELREDEGDLDVEFHLVFPDERAARGQRVLVSERLVHRADGPGGERNGILPDGFTERLFGDAPRGVAEFPRDGGEKDFARLADLDGAIALQAAGGRCRQAVAGLDEPHGAVADLASLLFGRVGQIEERLIRRPGSVHVDVVVESAPL